MLWNDWTFLKAIDYDGLFNFNYLLIVTEKIPIKQWQVLQTALLSAAIQNESSSDDQLGLRIQQPCDLMSITCHKNRSIIWK